MSGNMKVRLIVVGWDAVLQGRVPSSVGVVRIKLLSTNRMSASILPHLFWRGSHLPR